MAVTNLQVAPKYAEALFEAATDAGNVSAVRDDLTQLQAVLTANPQLLKLFAAHNVSAAKLRELIATLTTGATTLTIRLVNMLVDYGRIGALPAVIDAFAATEAKALGELTATVTTAVALTPAQAQSLSAAVAAKFGANTVTLKETVDPAVIGGVRIAANNRIIDGTVAKRLEKLHAAMLQN